MIVYRLIRERYQTTPLSAVGAHRVGGRWNPVYPESILCRTSPRSGHNPLPTRQPIALITIFANSETVLL